LDASEQAVIGWAGKSERRGSKGACAPLDGVNGPSLWLGRTLQGRRRCLAHACKEEQRRQRARGRSDRVRSALTQKVKLIEARKINIHANFVRITSGQLPFLGL